jgi:hypothetical protein
MKKKKIKGKRVLSYEIKPIQVWEYLIKDQYGDVYRRGTSQKETEAVDNAERFLNITVKYWNANRKPNEEIFEIEEKKNE